MTRWLKRAVKSLMVISVALLLFALFLQAAGFRFNTSHSISIGWYRTCQAPIHRGAYVLVCPPDTPLFQQARRRGYLTHGHCPGGYGYLMKKVAALSSDTWVSNPTGIAINGHDYPHSRPLTLDGQGRSLPQVTTALHRLQASELLLMTDQSDTSFDGRYFGLLQVSDVVAVLKPVLVWPSSMP